MLELLTQLRAEQRERWAKGERILVEAYLERHPELGAAEEAAVDLIYSEFLLREELGETPQPDDYTARFPRYAASLRSQLELHALLRATQPLEPPTPRTLPRGPSAETHGRPADQTPGMNSRAAAAPPEELPRIPGYEIFARLGAGGPGVVYRARELSLDRDVALKMLRHEEDASGPEGFAQMEREARTAAGHNDPHIVQVYHFGLHDGRPYFTMEYVEGGSLAEALRAGPLEPREAVRLIEKLARTLYAVHGRKIVHRDLKPANVLLTAAREPKVADFGLAKRLDSEASLNPSGMLVGTVAYMAPEQAAGKNREVGPAADVWALGAILYECVTGRRPFPGKNTFDILCALRQREPVPPRRLRHGLPRDVETICLKCLEKDPGKRYASALQLAEDCAAFLRDEPLPHARRRRWYEKLGRWVRRHPFETAAAVLLLTAAVGMPLVINREELTAPDPEQIRREAEATLKAGKPYVLQGDELLPGPLRCVIGTKNALSSNPTEKCVTVETFGLVLIELVADPGQDRYRFSSWVRHDGTGEESYVGLYFDYRERQDGQGLQRAGFYTLSFADRGKATRRDKGPNGEPISYVLLNSHHYAERPQMQPYFAGGIISPGKAFEPGPAFGPLSPWRKLILTITPEGVEASWQNAANRVERVVTISAAAMKERDAIQRLSTPETVSIPADFRPRRGLGLYVNAGKASFRGIVLEPLPPGK
jgi:hypothetical protein